MARHPREVTARRSPGEGGFTLVEILVVIAILAALMGLVAALIPKALQKGRIAKTQALLVNISAELLRLESSREDYGRFPPTHTKALILGKRKVGEEIGEPNATNVGIETVYFLYNNPDVPASQVTTDPDLIGNSDNDQFRVNRGRGSDTQAREYLDAWGRPLVYFNARDYKDPKGLTTVLTPEGPVEVKPKKMAKTADFYGPSSYQVFSLGPNGVQDADDDPDSDDLVVSGR